MSSRCAPALHYKVSGIGRKRLPHHARKALCTKVGQTLSSVNPAAARRTRWQAPLGALPEKCLK